MRKVIIKKINNLLISHIDSEEKTQYLLVQIFKVQKLDGLPKSYIGFFRDWLVHEEISRKYTTDFFLNRFESYIVGSDAHKIAKEFILKERHFFEFSYLKNEIYNFLQANKLPTDLTDIRKNWLIFIRLLVEILKECPVKCKGGKIDHFNLIEDVRGNICFRFHLNDHKNIVRIKLKIKRI